MSSKTDMTLAEKIDAKLEKWRNKPRSKSILEVWGRLYDGPAGFILFQIVAIPVLVCFSVVEKLGNYWWSYVLAGIFAMVALAISLSILSRVSRKVTPSPEEE